MTDLELKPCLRFKGFTEAWEQREVNEIANRYDNLRVPVASSQRVEGTTPYYGANGIQDYVDGYTHEGEFVLVAEDGANDLKNYPVQYVNGRIWINNHAHVLQSNQNNDTKFLKYLISSTNIENLLVGGGRAKLNAEVLMKIDLTLPKKQEQIKISTLFDSLDFLITLHQRKQLFYIFNKVLIKISLLNQHLYFQVLVLYVSMFFQLYSYLNGLIFLQHLQ